VSLTARTYTDAGVEEYAEPAAAREAPGETWVHATAAEDGTVERLRETFGLHALAVEDVRDGSRPKTTAYDDHVFVLVKTARLAGGDVAFHKEIRTEPVGVFLGDDWMVTLSVTDDALSAATDRLLAHPDRITARGVDFLAYRLLDSVVDGYFDVLDDVEDDIEAIESRVLDETDPELLAELNDVRRDLLAFRKVVWPAREAVGTLSRGDVPQVTEETETYFRDVYDHLVAVVDLIETYRDLTTGSRDIYLNTVSMSTNEVMKTLTVVAAIFIPLTFVAGVYGMNFSGSPYAMPELGWRYGYPAVMVGMGAVAALLLVGFRRQGWL